MPINSVNENGGFIGVTRDLQDVNKTGIWSFESVHTSTPNTPPAPAQLYTFTTANFTSGGVTGQNGPSLAQAVAGLTGTGTDTWKNNTQFFNTINGIQVWTVPQTRTYTIEAGGGRGGGNGGNGARIRASFQLTAGDIVYILVGQTGSSSSCGGGGGGGTFVGHAKNLFGANLVTWAAAPNNYVYPLVVAGGGGGQRDSGTRGPDAGRMTTTGSYPGNETGASGGNGGFGGATTGAGGWTTNGANGATSIQNFTNTGKSFVNGGVGGNNNRAIGNFGGGAGGTCEVCNTGAGAGGGGGYSGASARTNAGTCYEGGGGGGSFIHSTAVGTVFTSDGTWSGGTTPHSVYTGGVSSIPGYNQGSGYVSITAV
jgi:hypothetical protein